MKFAMTVFGYMTLYNLADGYNVSKEPTVSIFIIVVSCSENVSNMFL